MKKVNVKKLVILLLIFMIVCVSFAIFSKKEKVNINNKANMEIDVFFDGQDTPICIKAETINKINEDFFDVKLNLEEKTAIVDDETIPLNDFLGVEQEEVEAVIASSGFK